MALVTTTLATAATATDSTIVVTSATSVATGRLIRIDQEFMEVIQGYNTGTTVGVLRGRNGTAAVAHNITANVVHGTAADFTVPPAGTVITVPVQRARRVVSITATSTLTLPLAGEDLFVILNGTAAITLTIPVPTKDLDGCELTIVGNGVAQHIPTFTGGLSGAGSSYDAFTVNATAPVAIKAVAVNGLWIALSAPAWTGTVTALVGGIA